MFAMRKKLLVGIDIGTHSIKVVRLKQRGKGYQLLNFGVMPLRPEAMVDTHRWSAKAFSKKDGRPIEGSVCATVWPTRTLADRERWFDELYVWTEGFQASTTQRARIQVAALDHALRMLDCESADSVGITLSFGTAERHLDAIVKRLQLYPLVAHRVVVILRGAFDRVRSQYRSTGRRATRTRRTTSCCSRRSC